ncbi:sensor histidine kinase [Streptomyces sp. A7024]|uniref:histidine kinase n=1 Tax=Streptomyces coryli TaxID=1128680 RepID=A0A6G4UAI2_9ACTN|nr:histidine kinase [Streptomyces coryli]NGN69239.1 sensor histidine kinase [Streptomyces coryli]
MIRLSDPLLRLARSPRTLDALVWLLIMIPLLSAQRMPGGEEQATGIPLLWTQIAAVPLLALACWYARRAPLLAAAVPIALGLAATPELFTNNFTFAQVILCFLLGRRSGATRGPLLLFVAAAVTGLVLLSIVPGASVPGWGTLLLTLLFGGVLPWLVGRYARQQAELVRTGWELAERLEREQELVADRMRLRERSRIAGDMHDSLGHELGLIALRAAALQVSPRLDDADRTSAAELREAAATATERLREIIGVLREDGEDAPVHPADDTIEALVKRARDSGMAVTLEQPGDAGSPLPPMADRALYRVVQEALTNAAKHAPGAAVTVTLRRTNGTAEVAVANEPPPAGPLPSAAVSGGYGLVGLDERVRLAGGTLHAQPVDSGFEVKARLPVTPGAAATPPREYVSQRELAAARRKVHRGILDAIWIPIAGTIAIAVVLYGFNIYTSYRSVLDADTYADLHIGRPEHTVEQHLPAYQADDDTRPEHAPPDPPGTDECRFYRTTAWSLDPAYRLCFTDGRLSHKGKVKTQP